jgi:glycosyltransferase involved in cell wall biosynthesis
MAYGKPVIATRYSGNLDFMSEDNAYLIDCSETEVTVPEGPFPRGSVWAEPSVDHAVEAMRQVFRSCDEASAVGRCGREGVLAALSPEAVGKRVRKALRTQGL